MIEQIVSRVAGIAAHHGILAYAIICLMAAAEALPVLGVVMPGVAVILGFGVLASYGGLDIWPLMVASVVGAVAGDGLSFWLGSHFGPGLATRWPLRKSPKLVARGQALIQRHGGKAVFLSRFASGTRAFVPLAAGMLRMQPARFYAFNIGSALIWAPGYILIGVLLGGSLHLVTAIAGRLAVFLILLIAILWVAIWLARRVILGIGPRALKVFRVELTRWATARNTWPRRQLLELFHAQWREPRALLTEVVLFIACLWLFLGILEDVLTGDPLVQASGAVFHLLQSLRTTWGDHLMVAMTGMGAGVVTTAVTLAVLVWLLWRRTWRTAAYWLIAVVGAAVFTAVIEYSINWPRPTDLYSGWNAFSFASHVTINTVLYGFLGFLVARELRPRLRAWVIGGACVLIALIAASRLYLGTHWLAEIGAGILIGTAWVTLLAIIYSWRLRPRRVGAGQLLGVAVLAFAATWGFHLAYQYQHDILRYAPRQEVQLMSLADWRAGAYRQLPARRIDMVGETEEPLTLQWLGGLACLQHQLAQAGWQPSVPWTLASAIRWLDTGVDALTLPVLPKLHDGRAPVLRMVHPVTSNNVHDARLVLLVWPSSVNVVTGRTRAPAPLWLGSVVRQRFYHPLGLFTLARTLPSMAAARHVLASSLPRERTVRRSVAPYSLWDGRLILASCGMSGLRIPDDHAQNQQHPGGPTS